jgi:hypothetical protein
MENNEKIAMYVEYWEYRGGWVYYAKPVTGSYGNMDVITEFHVASSKKEAVKLATERAKELGLDTLYVSYSPNRPLHVEIAVESA